MAGYLSLCVRTVATTYASCQGHHVRPISRSFTASFLAAFSVLSCTEYPPASAIPNLLSMAAQTTIPAPREGAPSPTTPRLFEHAQGLIEVLPDKIDVEEEARLYEELCDVSRSCDIAAQLHQLRCSQTPVDSEYEYPQNTRPSMDTPSIYSKDIWLGDHSGESQIFAREVEVIGWTSVGDKRGGAYIGESADQPYSPPCASLKLKGGSVRLCYQNQRGTLPSFGIVSLTSNDYSQGTVIHVHKRYSAFAELYAHLRARLPVRALTLTRSRIIHISSCCSKITSDLYPLYPRSPHSPNFGRLFSINADVCCSIGCRQCCYIQTLGVVKYCGSGSWINHSHIVAGVLRHLSYLASVVFIHPVRTLLLLQAPS